MRSHFFTVDKSQFNEPVKHIRRPPVSSWFSEGIDANYRRSLEKHDSFLRQW